MVLAGRIQAAVSHLPFLTLLLPFFTSLPPYFKSHSQRGKPVIRALITFFFVGLITLIVGGIVISVVGAVLGTAFGLASFLLFKVAPILLVGWVALKVFQKFRGRQDSLSAADRRWLDSE